MATKRPPSKAARKPASKRKPARRRPPRLRDRIPTVEPYHLDLIGLGLVALGILMAVVLYFDRAGGKAGEALTDGARAIVGLVAYGVPVALVMAGALVVFRPYLPAGRPLRAGAGCLFAALTLGLAAGTIGIGPGSGGGAHWSRAFVDGRGGYIGEAAYWVTSTLFSTTGAHLIAILLLLAAVLLLSGATIAGVLHSTHESVVTTGARLLERTSPTPATTPVAPSTAAGRTAAIQPPEPDASLVVRATHVEAPPLDALERSPGLFGDTSEIVAGRGAPPDDVDESEPEGDPVLDAPAAELAAQLGDDHDAGRDPRDVAGSEDLTPMGRYRASVLEDENFEWHKPEPGLLKRSDAASLAPDTTGQEKTSFQLLEALGHFGIEAKVVATVTGPHITRYELRLAPGTKMTKVANLKDDLAYALAATDIRILAPIPGKQAVGVEVPNIRRRLVHLGDVYQEPPRDHSPLTVWLGKDVSGKAIGVDLTKMPHLLVAGTTGAGKSAAVNAMLSSILLRADPHEVRLVLVDPKQVELNHYDSIPHLLTPVITSPRMAANALQNLVREMEERYGMMSLARTRTLLELNKARAKRNEAPLPYILCVIDELADLMMVAPADVEDSIIRLAQKARAVGMHLVLATQSPRVDVITGMIKANVPSRIAFAVSSQIDSRVILDQNGAESLLGKGDMLFAPIGTSRLARIQGAYIDESEILAITDFWRKQGEPEFREELLEKVEAPDEPESADEGFDPNEDPLLEEAISLVAQMGTASTSMLQRRLRLGYTRAGRLIDMLERRGVISGYEGSKPRQVLISEADVPRVLTSLHERDSKPPPVESTPGGDACAEDASTVEIGALDES